MVQLSPVLPSTCNLLLKLGPTLSFSFSLFSEIIFLPFICHAKLFNFVKSGAPQFLNSLPVGPWQHPQFSANKLDLDWDMDGLSSDLPPLPEDLQWMDKSAITYTSLAWSYMMWLDSVHQHYPPFAFWPHQILLTPTSPCCYQYTPP